MTCLPSPIKLYYPSMLQVSKAEYRSGLIVNWATVQIVAGPKFLGIVWVKDNAQSSTTKIYALNEVQVAPS